MISVVIPMYNSKDTIFDSIDSIINQSRYDLIREIIVVDDGSTDGSSQFVSEHYAENKKIKVIRKKNGGVSSARNAGIQSALSEWIAFLDSDDIWDKKKLFKQLCFMEENLYAITFTSYQKINAITRKKGKVIKIPKIMTYEKIFGNTAMACLTVMVNRKAVGEFYMPSLAHTEDQCTWQDILNRGYVAYGLDENLAYYREGNMSLTIDKKRSIRQQWRTYRDYYKFGRMKSIYYFIQYFVNATIKHM